MGLKKKHLLDMQSIAPEEIKLILDTASSMKEILFRSIKKVPTLRGRTIANVFYEPSTRTRVSFELAAKYLSADCINVSAAASSIVKGESLVDTARTLRAMGADVIVLRHPYSGAPYHLAKLVSACVINAGDGTHEHPTQALLDLFTVQEAKGELAALKIAIVGDILHSRVARSNILGFTKMGATVRICGPTTMIPVAIERTGAHLYTQVEEALDGVDVVMMLRLQLERQQQGLFPSVREYTRLYGLDQQRLALAKPDALVMHPGPLNRGVEITSAVADSAQSVINTQVTNGVAVRMALLYLLAGRFTGGQE
jgi:aspartate carbamoyltransferase catalytic subunit